MANSRLSHRLFAAMGIYWSFVILLAVVMCVGGCGGDVPKANVAVVTEKQQFPVMSDMCHADKLEKFKPAKANPDGTGEADGLAHALQSNKSRMARNEGRALACECSVASLTKNEADTKRLEGKCETAQPVPPAKVEPKTS